MAPQQRTTDESFSGGDRAESMPRISVIAV